jgi:hypothetical protein
MERRRRVTFILVAALITLGGALYENLQQRNAQQGFVQNATTITETSSDQKKAIDELAKLEVKGRAPKTGYKRSAFGDGWNNVGGCDVRNLVLKRDMTEVITRSETDCTVMQGKLGDPYTGKEIQFVRGPDTSDDVQIDHIVALSDAWQKGAQGWDDAKREEFSNDPLNLLAVDGETNQKKGDSDAATWLPPNKDYRCRYISRQIAVKVKYGLWVTEAERAAMQQVLATCPAQVLPIVQ